MPKGLKRYYGQGQLHFLSERWNVGRLKVPEMAGERRKADRSLPHGSEDPPLQRKSKTAR
jgi:hypothetical protein